MEKKFVRIGRMIWTTFVARATRCSVQGCSVGAWDNLPPLSVNSCLDLRVLLDLRALLRALLLRVGRVECIRCLRRLQSRGTPLLRPRSTSHSSTINNMRLR